MKNGGHTKRIIDSCSIIIAPQVATLTPVAEAVGQFTKDYKSFATAVDTTRHELPVKNFYIDGDRREFLGNFYVKLISTILKKQTKKKTQNCTDADSIKPPYKCFDLLLMLVKFKSYMEKSFLCQTVDRRRIHTNLKIYLG